MKTEITKPFDNILILRFNILCFAMGGFVILSGYIYTDLYSWIKILLIYLATTSILMFVINKLARRKGKET
jgi:hypothetical protein